MVEIHRKGRWEGSEYFHEAEYVLATDYAAIEAELAKWQSKGEKCSDDLLKAHEGGLYDKGEVDALEAERDELKRRLDAMVDIYEDLNLSERVANEYIVDPTPEQVKEVQYVLARVSRIHLAIAEGRDNG